jgi:hypothetical protein
MRGLTYNDFFAGFNFGNAPGFFATFEENLPVGAGFGSPRILIYDYLLSALKDGC